MNEKSERQNMDIRSIINQSGIEEEGRILDDLSKHLASQFDKNLKDKLSLIYGHAWPTFAILVLQKILPQIVATYIVGLEIKLDNETAKELTRKLVEWTLSDNVEQATKTMNEILAIGEKK